MGVGHWAPVGRSLATGLLIATLALGQAGADAAYGLGFAQSEDDFATIQDSLFTSRGRQAELKGPEGVPSDTLTQLVKVSGILAAGYERDLSPKVRGVLDAYAAGVNRYAALHPEKVAKGLLPVTGRDIYGRSDPDGRLHAVNGDCYLMFID